MEFTIPPKHGLILIFAILLLFTSIPHTHSGASPSPSAYIAKSCSSCTYPSLCLTTLTPYAAAVGTNPLKLCKAALSVALQEATACSTTVSKQSKLQRGISRPDALAIKDCVGDLKHAVYELKQTVSAMKHLSDADREFQWANAKTYASAAITDADTCVDGFLGRRVNGAVKKKIRGCVKEVEMRISNALYLINHLYSTLS